MRHSGFVTRTPRESWIEQGLKALATGGPDAVRVEALAKQLGVTKGGFYGSFADRDALLTAMLETWERESTDDVAARVAEKGGDLVTRTKRAGVLTFSTDRLLPIDLAVRDWARRDEAVAERLRRVDNRRMTLLRESIGTFCSDPDEVEARSVLAFCLLIGEHFLAADHGGRTRAEVLARAGDVIFARKDAHPTGKDAGKQDVESLGDVRARIDDLDTQIVALLARRQTLVEAAAGFKTDEQAVRAPDRVERVVAAVRAKATAAGLDADVAESVWRSMITAFTELELARHRDS
ncbi:chorismate mutase [Actinoplanes sp. Pm04-4]|uniref:Chorismate mutase n=1 Tax=Paractinoplanes pyxinae TaxID=2997416 RepID=A0ABT4ARD6_9ACTN|nr:chorismate mutase [Actinoplanes pyxinae]MCY1136377.1 chorismate mutase [Actinoplanes pyxinae]